MTPVKATREGKRLLQLKWPLHKRQHLLKAFFLIVVFSIQLTENVQYKFWWLDSNCGPLESETTILPTESQPLPKRQHFYNLKLFMLSNLVANLLVALLGNCAIRIVLKSVSSVWKWPKHWSLVQCTWAWEWNGGQSEAIIAAVTVAASASATSKRWANNNLNFKFFLLPGALFLSICLPTYLPMLIHFFMLFTHGRMAKVKFERVY